MSEIFFTHLCIALIIFSIWFVLQPKSIFKHPEYLVLFFTVYGLDNLLIVQTNRFPALQLIPNQVWEGFLVCGWSGKLYSILAMLMLLIVVKKILSKDEIGLSFRQEPGSAWPALAVLLFLSAWALFVGYNSPKGKFDLATLVYLAIMPGLNEELVYRGFLFGILNKAFPGKVYLCAAPVGIGIIISSLLFGLLHGFWLDSSLAVHMDWLALRNSTLSGCVFAWLRARTGSILMPVMAHGLEDFLFFLPRMI